MKILFVCKHNRFRSRVASAYFNKLNENTKNISKGAGIYSDNSPLDSDEVEIAQDEGINIKGKPQQINSKLINWVDKIVIVADDVSKSDLKVKNKKIIVWKIKDVDNAKNVKKAIRETILKIKNKIDEFK